MRRTHTKYAKTYTNSISVVLEFSNYDFKKKYAKSFRSYVFRRQLPVCILIGFIMTCLGIFGASFDYVDIFGKIHFRPLYIPNLFTYFCIEGIFLVLTMVGGPYITGKKMLDLECEPEIVFVFSPNSFKGYTTGNVFRGSLEYNSLYKIKITKKEFLLSIDQKRMLFLPRVLLSTEEQEQLTLWLKNR